MGARPGSDMAEGRFREISCTIASTGELTRAELYDRDLTRASTRISNPGCYATNNQLLLAPLMPYLDPASPPSSFGVSGYSGAGTKSGQKDQDGLPVTLPKVVRIFIILL